MDETGMPAQRLGLNKLSVLLRPEFNPDDVRATLAAALFTRTTTLLASALCCLAVALVALFRLPSGWVVAWMAVDVIAYAGRFALIGAYQRRAVIGRSRDPDRWVALYTIGGVATQLMMGIGCAACLLVGDRVLILFSSLVVAGIAGALASRNAGLPRLAIVQLAGSLLPIVAGALFAADRWLLGEALAMLVYLGVLSSIVQRNHRDLMQLARTERANARLLRRFRYLAQHDSLTALANRAQLLEHLAASCAGLGATLTNTIAVLYLDLDGFKAVNDSLGHTAGDALLRAVADRLREATRHGDVVARLGGDEFAVVRQQTSLADAEMLAADLVARVALPYQLGPGQAVKIGLSLGLALAPDHARDPHALLRRADMALYAAKMQRKGSFYVFDPALERKALARRALENELRQAIATGQGLVLHYQPIVKYETGEITAREALVRWAHPERGLISPAEFIPLAEETGLILPLGEWVLRTACAAAAAWADTARVSVNVSPVQLSRANRLPDLVQQALIASGLSSNRLELEVTETALLQDDAVTLTQLQRLRELGVMIALDDFGTGFSSLANLRSFAFDRIKIDGSFVRDALTRPHCAAIVRAVADLGRRLGAVTVAEGVETEEQLDMIRREGCGEAQGFLFGRPHPAVESRAALGTVAPVLSAGPTVDLRTD